MASSALDGWRPAQARALRARQAAGAGAGPPHVARDMRSSFLLISTRISNHATCPQRTWSPKFSSRVAGVGAVSAGLPAVHGGCVHIGLPGGGGAAIPQVGLACTQAAPSSHPTMGQVVALLSHCTRRR